MCTWFDETVGALRDVLDERGVADDTVVVYVTDNGWINRRDASRYAPRSKRSPYDGGLRTPIMVHWPGHVAPGRSDALACSIDLAPTILTLAGVDVPAELPGVDLLDSAAIEARSVLHGVVYSHDAVDYAEPGANWEYRWCVADGWKLITPNTARLPGAATQLYKIVDDAHEQNDLAAAMPEVVERLSKSIEAWMSE